MYIREAEEGDLKGLLILYTQLHENDMPACSPKLHNLWQEILQDRHHHIIVAEENGKIVSSCVILVIPNLTQGQRPYALIENVITENTHREKGFASACLHYAKELAKRYDCYKIMLMTGSKEEKTLSFYRKAGYQADQKTAFVQWL